MLITSLESFVSTLLSYITRYLFVGILLLTLSSSSCESNESSQSILVYQYLIEDISTTRNGAQRLDFASLEGSIKSLTTTQRQIDTQVGHVSQKYPDPATFRTELLPPEPSMRSTDYLDKKEERDKFLERQDSLFGVFASEFAEKLTDFQLTPATDFSYIQKHLRTLSFYLSDTSSAAPRIGVISTDFINHEPGGIGKLIDTATVSLLNRSLDVNPRSRLYIISDNPNADKLGLRATPLSSWTQYFDILSNTFIKKNS